MDAQLSQTLATNVVRSRSDRGWSAAELARRAGVDARTIANVERARNATLQTVIAVAAALEVTTLGLLAEPVGRLEPITVVRAELDGAAEPARRRVTNLASIVNAPGSVSHVDHICLGAGTSDERHATGPQVVTRLYVLTGTLEVALDEAAAQLSAGDFATLRGAGVTRLHTDAGATALHVVSLELVATPSPTPAPAVRSSVAAS